MDGSGGGGVVNNHERGNPESSTPMLDGKGCSSSAGRKGRDDLMLLISEITNGHDHRPSIISVYLPGIVAGHSILIYCRSIRTSHVHILYKADHPSCLAMVSPGPASFVAPVILSLALATPPSAPGTSNHLLLLPSDKISLLLG